MHLRYFVLLLAGKPNPHFLLKSALKKPSASTEVWINLFLLSEPEGRFGEQGNLLSGFRVQLSDVGYLLHVVIVPETVAALFVTSKEGLVNTHHFFKQLLQPVIAV